jgi:antitoxin MazE
MKIHAKVQKWGNGLAIRISGVMRDIPHFEIGTPLEIDVLETGLNIRKLQSEGVRFPFSESDLLRDMTPESAHADIIPHLLNTEY